MKSTQRLQLEQLDLKTKLNALLGVDGDLTDEQRAEMDAHTKRLEQSDGELRAAIHAEGDDEARALAAHGADGADGESAERRRLLEGVSVCTDYLARAASGVGLEGRASELNAAMELPAVGKSGGVIIPWEALERREAVEQRAFSTTAASDGGVMQRPILARLYAAGIMDSLGIRLDSIPYGRAEWNVITSGVAPSQVKEGTAAAAAVTVGFTTTTLRPKRLTGRYELTHEMAASVSDIEQALRRDLADGIKSKMSSAAINGASPTDSAPQNIEGFLTALDVPDDAAATAVFADYGGAHAAGVDGLHAEMENEVSSVIGTDVYRHSSSVYQAGSGEAGSEALKRRSMSCRASSYIPAAANTGQSKVNIFHASGPNGGGGIMRGDSVGGLWSGLEMVRDPYSQASIGIVLTWIAIWDLKVALRSDSYVRQAFKIT